MKALAIDSAVTKFTVAVKNGNQSISCTYDVGMRQSELLLPAVDYALKTAGITSAELDYTSVCMGPGSFTGLRLAFSALKAIKLAHGVPLYGVPTLDAYSYHYKNLPFTILCAVDAKKDRFYAKATCMENVIFADGDYTPEEIIKKIENQTEILICGSDSQLFYETTKNELKNKSIHLMPFKSDISDALFSITEEYIQNKMPPLKDYDGPVYIRPSEAEEHIAQTPQR